MLSYSMSLKSLLSAYLGTLHIANFALSGLSAFYLYGHSAVYFYITSISVGLTWLLQILISFKSKTTLALSIFGLNFYFYPFISTNPRKKSIAIQGTALEMMYLTITGLVTSITVKSSVPEYIQIVRLVFISLENPLIYEGVTLTHTQRLSRFILLFVESIVTYSFFWQLSLLNKSYIILAAFFWRVALFFDPYAMWISLHSLVFPYEALALSAHSRTLLLPFCLNVEFFLLIYTSFFHSFSVFTLLASILFCITLVIEINPSFSNKIKPLKF